jgi:hypothetical protein
LGDNSWALDNVLIILGTIALGDTLLVTLVSVLCWDGC